MMRKVEFGGDVDPLDRIHLDGDIQGHRRAPRRLAAVLAEPAPPLASAPRRLPYGAGGHAACAISSTDAASRSPVAGAQHLVPSPGVRPVSEPAPQSAAASLPAVERPGVGDAFHPPAAVDQRQVEAAGQLPSVSSARNRLAAAPIRAHCRGVTASAACPRRAFTSTKTISPGSSTTEIKLALGTAPAQGPHPAALGTVPACHRLLRGKARVIGDCGRAGEASAFHAPG